MLTHHRKIEAIGKIFRELNAALDGERVLDFGVGEGNAKVNFAFGIGVDHVANAGGTAVEALGETGEITFAIFPHQGRDVCRQQQSQVTAKSGVIQLGIGLDGVDGPEGDSTHR